VRAKGITYDTGFVRGAGISREHFDPDVVRRELAIIRDDLHCNAVQLIGGDPGRLEVAASHAAGLGLEVWFSPYPLELTAGEILALFTDCADRAERLRQQGAEVVFVAGVELTLMNRGFLPGGTVDERLGLLLGRPDRGERLAEVSARLNDFLGEAAAAIRARFGGRITYAAIPTERVDWAPFDIVSVELIRSAEVAHQFSEGVRQLVAGEKPVAMTGFGTAAYRDAGDRGGRVMEILEYDQDTGAPVRLDGEYVRDEAGGLRCRGRRRHLRVPLRAGQPPAPPRWRSPGRPGPGQPGHRQGARGPPRRYLPRHDLGAQGRLHHPGRVLPRLTTTRRSPDPGVWCATKLATDAGGWRQVNRAAFPYVVPA
jgi:hypothetical protein